MFNKLKLKANKTVHRMFEQINTDRIPISIKISELELKRVITNKYLGLHIDERLNRRIHITRLQKKIYSMVIKEINI